MLAPWAISLASVALEDLPECPRLVRGWSGGWPRPRLRQRVPPDDRRDSGRRSVGGAATGRRPCGRPSVGRLAGHALVHGKRRTAWRAGLAVLVLATSSQAMR